MKTEAEIKQLAEERYPYKLNKNTTWILINDGKIDGFIAGFTQSQEADKWISVDERLPEITNNVLATHKFINGNTAIICAFYTKGHEVAIDDPNETVDPDEYEKEMGQIYLKPGWYEDQEQLQSEFDNIFYPREITHWRPLPQTPQDLTKPGESHKM